MMVTLLRHHGHRRIETADSREGLATAPVEHPVLVITDVLMPVMDGYEFVRQLRLDPGFYVLTKAAESQEALTIVGRVLSCESETGMPSDAAPLTLAGTSGMRGF